MPCTFWCPQLPLNGPTSKTGTLRSSVSKKKNLPDVRFLGSSIRGSIDPQRIK